VQVLLNLPKLPTPDDAADALATAITHHNHQRYQDAIERSSQDT
jgi:Holliday junction resolvasome RuvABC endonuclease subunit